MITANGEQQYNTTSFMNSGMRTCRSGIGYGKETLEILSQLERCLARGGGQGFGLCEKRKGVGKGIWLRVGCGESHCSTTLNRNPQAASRRRQWKSLQ